MLGRLFVACRDLGVSAGLLLILAERVGYYVELIGIKGLNWLSKHFINREWIAACERFIGGAGC